MIGFFIHEQGNVQGMDTFARLALQADENVTLIGRPEAPAPHPWARRLCPHDPAELAAPQWYRREGGKSGCLEFPDNWEAMQETAVDWWAHFIRGLELEPLEIVATWGSGQLVNRCLIRAAQDLGIRVCVLEDGWFPLRQEGRPWVASSGAAYYEGTPPLWREQFAAHELDAERLDGYRVWWRQSRTTKYTGTMRHRILVDSLENTAPVEWVDDDEHLLWAGQLPGDAALYWGIPAGAWTRLRQDAVEAGAWYKPHPYSNANEYPEAAGCRVLPGSLAIHEVLPDAQAIAVLTSAVGLEAWLYGTRTAVYGAPFYADLVPGPGSFAEALAEAPDQHERDRLLDFLIHSLQFHQHDPRGFVERLRAA